MWWCRWKYSLESLCESSPECSHDCTSQLDENQKQKSGGNKKDGLISEAKAKLSSKANLIGKPKALANEVVDIKTQIIFGIITRYTVTVSADVVEFK